MASLTAQNINNNTGNIDLTNEPCGCPESKVNNDELKITFESEPSQGAYALSLKFGVSKQIILTELKSVK